MRTTTRPKNIPRSAISLTIAGEDVYLMPDAKAREIQEWLDVREAGVAFGAAESFPAIWNAAGFAFALSLASRARHPELTEAAWLALMERFAPEDAAMLAEPVRRVLESALLDRGRGEIPAGADAVTDLLSEARSMKAANREFFDGGWRLLRAANPSQVDSVDRPGDLANPLGSDLADGDQIGAVGGFGDIGGPDGGVAVDGGQERLDEASQRPEDAAEDKPLDHAPAFLCGHPGAEAAGHDEGQAEGRE